MSDITLLSMPRGRLYFTPMNSEWVTTGGEIDVGNCSRFSIKQSHEFKEHFTSHSRLVTLDNKPLIPIKHTCEFEAEERSYENMVLALLGNPNLEKTYYSQAGGTLSSYSFVVRLDRWVNVEKKYLKVGSVKIVSPVSVDLTSLPVNDYRINYETGAIMFMEGNSISLNDGDVIILLFKFGTTALDEINVTTTVINGILKYAGKSDVGVWHEIVCNKVQLQINGALDYIKTKEIASLVFIGDLFEVNSEFFQKIQLGSATPYTPPSRTPNAWYKGEDNANDSIDSNHGTYTGEYDAGFVNRCFKITAENDDKQIAVPHSDLIDFRQSMPFEVELYIKVQLHETFLRNYFDIYFGYLDFYVSMDKENFPTEFYMWFFGSYGAHGYTIPWTSWPEGTWVKIRFTFDSGIVRLFINDVEITPSTPAEITVGESIWGIDTDIAGSNSGITWIDELKIFKEAVPVADFTWGIEGNNDTYSSEQESIVIWGGAKLCAKSISQGATSWLWEVLAYHYDFEHDLWIFDGIAATSINENPNNLYSIWDTFKIRLSINSGASVKTSPYIIKDNGG